MGWLFWPSVFLLAWQVRAQEPFLADKGAAATLVSKLGGSVGPSTKALGSRVELHGKTLDEKTLVGLRAVPDIVELSLGSTPITDKELPHLAGFPRLKYLGVRNTRITDEGLAIVKTLTGLRGLDLAGTLITDQGLAHLKEMPSLEELTLDGTKVTDAGLTHLKELPRLRELHLARTAITDAGLEHLRALPALRLVTLRDTRASEPAVLELEKARPDVEVAFSFHAERLRGSARRVFPVVVALACVLVPVGAWLLWGGLKAGYFPPGVRTPALLLGPALLALTGWVLTSVVLGLNGVRASITYLLR